MSNNAHELRNRLLNALDNNYNVVDMQAVNGIISILEKFNITKELLETTRLGKHVNELRRKTSDPTLARRAKVLVKRWRDLVIPAVASPAHTGPGSNRSSAERCMRRLGGTPLTSPALSRHVVSPAVPSPRLPARPAWGGYESDSQDVILVDDDPPAAPLAPVVPPLAPHAPMTPHAPLTPVAPLMPLVALAAHKPRTPPIKRPPSPEPLQDEKKAKRDKKPKKRRGHSRAGSGTETTTPAISPLGHAGAHPAHAHAQAHAWGARNGSGPAERRKNGWRKETPDPYAALVNRLPPAGAKKVKTTKELLEQLQSKGARPASRSRARSPALPGSPHSPDVMLIEPDDVTIKVDSPLRNGTGTDTTIAKVETSIEAEVKLEEQEPLEEEREWQECTCGEDEEDAACPAAAAALQRRVQPRHVHALHHAFVPGVNGTRAPAVPHQFAVRTAADAERPGLFASVVPLYNYSDYANDYCAKNMARVPICTTIPWNEFAPAPPSPLPPRDPPELRPYPWPSPPPAIDSNCSVEPNNQIDGDSSNVTDLPTEISSEPICDDKRTEVEGKYPTKVEPEMVSVPILEPSERLKAPLLSVEEATQFGAEPTTCVKIPKQFVSEPQEHRTVERTKGDVTKESDVDGQILYGLCQAALRTVPWRYEQTANAPVINASVLESPSGDDELQSALENARVETDRDELGRPVLPYRFAEWHEPARLGDLVALPYVVID